MNGSSSLFKSCIECFTKSLRILSGALSNCIRAVPLLLDLDCLNAFLKYSRSPYNSDLKLSSDLCTCFPAPKIVPREAQKTFSSVKNVNVKLMKPTMEDA